MDLKERGRGRGAEGYCGRGWGCERRQPGEVTGSVMVMMMMMMMNQNQNQNQNRLYCYQNPKVLRSTHKIVQQTMI